MLIGGDTAGIVSRVGTGGDTLYFGGTVAMQTTEKLQFRGNLAWLDIDDTMNADGVHSAVYGENPMEISGQAKYALGKGVTLYARLGMVNSDGPRDNAYWSQLRTAISF